MNAREINYCIVCIFPTDLLVVVAGTPLQNGRVKRHVIIIYAKTRVSRRAIMLLRDDIVVKLYYYIIAYIIMYITFNDV